MTGLSDKTSDDFREKQHEFKLYALERLVIDAEETISTDPIIDELEEFFEAKFA